MWLLKMGNANILRGKKWADERAKAVFENRSKDVDWFDSQESIVKDIKEYKDSIDKPTEKVKKAPKEA